MNENVVFALFLGVGIVGFFSFLAVTIWSRERRREREAYYKSETLKKIVETQGAGGSSAMECLHESEKYARLRQREWLKLAGLVTTAVGIGMMVFIKAVDRVIRRTLSGSFPCSLELRSWPTPTSFLRNSDGTRHEL